jgi:hypothetical protein
MTLDPRTLKVNLGLLESIEKATLRLVVQAIDDFKSQASEMFAQEHDLVADIGEDITREAIDRLGMSVIPVRLFGKMDYKRARYLFLPEFAIRQALFIDSKAESISGRGTATIQTAQTSMQIKQKRAGKLIEEYGKLPTIIEKEGHHLLTTTVFVKYNYDEASKTEKHLESISVLCLPNGLLQDRYNPNANETIWLAGRNAPSRDEAFRVRISLTRLKQKASWRVQYISLTSLVPFNWNE